MKKFIFKTMLVAACAMGFTACSDDSDEPGYRPDEFNTYGVFVINSGNMSNKINGSLDYIDLNTNTVTNNVFEMVNGRSLGITANDGFAYGSKLYIAVDGENTVEVMDVKTLKSLGQIKTNGAARHLAAFDGNVFVSSYSGEVCRIDTTSLRIDAKVDLGASSYPEGMCCYGGVLMVANSGYGSGNSISVIRLDNFTLANNIKCPTNPTDLVTDGNMVYLLTAGQYKADWSGYEVEPAVYKVVDANEVKEIYKATAFCTTDKNMYSFNANYYNPDITYSKYDINMGVSSNLNFGNDIAYPCAIAVDPITKHLWVSSYNLSEYGYADYSAPGYIVEYDENGNRLHDYKTGVGPISICFHTNLR